MRSKTASGMCDGSPVLRSSWCGRNSPPFRYGILPSSLRCLGRAVVLLVRKALEEQRQQEVAVEAVRPARLTGCQLVLQVVRVAVEEALLLDEVDEHQPVEHHRDVPAPGRRCAGCPRRTSGTPRARP